jgi:hypothetical protein
MLFVVIILIILEFTTLSNLLSFIVEILLIFIFKRTLFENWRTLIYLLLQKISFLSLY